MRSLFFVMLATLFSTTTVFGKNHNILEKEARANVRNIALEINSSKNVRQWIEKTPKRIKLFRRTHFSKNLKKKMPFVVYSDKSLVIHHPLSKKNGDLFEAKIKKGKIQYYYNGLNVSRRSKETLNTWLARVYGKKKKTKKKSAFWSFFVTSAYANGPVEWDTMKSLKGYQRNFWAAMIASMAVDEWKNKDLIEMGGVSSKQQFMALDASYFIQTMKDRDGLLCSSAEATFSYRFHDGNQVEIRTHFDKINKEKPLMRMELYKKNQQVGRFAYAVNSFGDPDVNPNFGTVIDNEIMTFNPAAKGAARSRTYKASMDQRNFAYEVGLMARSTPGNSENQSAIDNPLPYADDFEKIKVLSDVALAACSNTSLQKDSGAPGNPAGSNSIIRTSK